MIKQRVALKNIVESYRRYGVRGSIRLSGDLVSTKLSFPDARLIRRPAYIRGKRFMRIGAGFTTGPGLRMDAFPLEAGKRPVLVIGRDVEMNDYVHIAAVHSVTLGDRVLIASKVFITDHNHGLYKGPGQQSNPLVPPSERPLNFAAVHIEDDVWIGESVTILPGVTIGKGSVIGSMSMVNRNIPAYCIAIGSPARLIKRFQFSTSTWEAI